MFVDAFHRVLYKVTNFEPWQQASQKPTLALFQEPLIFLFSFSFVGETQPCLELDAAAT